AQRALFACRRMVNTTARAEAHHIQHFVVLPRNGIGLGNAERARSLRRLPQRGKRRRLMDQIELRIILSEELVHELLWHALAPEAFVITDQLNKALQQQNVQQVPLEEYQLSGISV